MVSYSGDVKYIKTYGTMYAYEADLEQALDVVSQYHAVTGLSEGSGSSGITYLASATGAITNTANNGGILRCTDVGHGLTTGQYVTLTGMGDVAHVGTTRVTVIDTDTFDCDNITYNSASDTGNWRRGASLTINSGRDGIYHFSFSASIFADGNNKNYKWEIVKNTTDLDEGACERMIAVQNDLGVVASSGLISLVGGDTIWMKVAGTTDATNVSIVHANLNMHKI